MTVTVGLLISQGLAYFLLGVALVSFLLRRDDRMEGLRKAAVDAIPRLAAGNHTILVDMCRDGATEDISGFVAQLINGFRTITDPKKSEAYFAHVLDGELSLQLLDKERAKAIKAVVDKAAAAHATP